MQQAHTSISSNREIQIRHTSPQTLCQIAHQSQPVPLPNRTHFPDAASNRTLILFWRNSKHTSFDGCVQESPPDIEKPHTPTVVGSQNKQHFVDL